MNNRFEHELSQFLDGRLPSGRRDQLLERIAEDPEAAHLLEEMEQAQDLARSLPMQQIGRSFSESLWQRIRSGEGTPDAVFHEPLSLWTKARYVASGAVAAAALIAGLHLVTRTGGEDASISGRTDRIEVADATPRPDRQLRPIDPGLHATPVLAQIMPQTIAQAGQFECVQAVSTLQTRAPDVQRRMAAADPRAVVVELDPVVGRARGSAHLIRWMQREDMLKLPSDFDTTLALTERILRRLELANVQNDAAQLRVAFEDLEDLEIDGLQRRFDIVCCTPPEEFQAQLREQIYRHPDVGRAIRLVLTNRGDVNVSEFRLMQVEPSGGDPFGDSFVILRNLPFGTVRVQGGGTQQVEFQVHVEKRDQGPTLDLDRRK